MQAVILAGGQGARLRPYTAILPKPLMPVGDHPILEVVIRQLRQHGFHRVTMAVGYLAELIEAYFRDGSKWGVKIEYSREEKPLGTAGPLSLIDQLEDRFLVMNGDILTTLNYGELMLQHSEKGPLVTVATCQKRLDISLGILEIDGGGLVRDYIEKPTLQHVVSMGVYAFDRRAIMFISRNEHLDLPTLIKRIIASGERVESYPFSGHWLDIGRPEDYEMAIESFDQLKSSFFEE